MCECMLRIMVGVPVRIWVRRLHTAGEQSHVTSTNLFHVQEPRGLALLLLRG